MSQHSGNQLAATSAGTGNNYSMGRPGITMAGQDATSNNRNGGTGSNNSSPTAAASMNFPSRLHAMLTEIDRSGTFSSIVSWSPHGRAFVVRDRTLFMEHVLPCFFTMSSFSSFQRQANIYGFRRLTNAGPDKGGYCHEHFLRGFPKLASRIPRQRLKGQGPRKPSCPNEEPDFHSMPVLSVTGEEEVYHHPQQPAAPVNSYYYSGCLYSQPYMGAPTAGHVQGMGGHPWPPPQQAVSSRHYATMPHLSSSSSNSSATTATMPPSVATSPVTSRSLVNLMRSNIDRTVGDMGGQYQPNQYHQPDHARSRAYGDNTRNVQERNYPRTEADYYGSGNNTWNEEDLEPFPFEDRRW